MQDLSGTPSTPRARATYADVLAAPEHQLAELINGQLFLSPPPAIAHAVTHSAILTDIRSLFGLNRPQTTPGGWHILLKPELHLGPAHHPTALVLVPDVAGWRRERLPELPDEPAFTLPPDWVCEVLSPGTERHDRLRKMDRYARAGVGWVWLVDPLARAVEVYALDGTTYRFLGGVLDEPVGKLPPFDAVELDLSEWWIRPSGG